MIMSSILGIYNRLQTCIKQMSKQTLCEQSVVHSLNSVGSNASDATIEATQDFFPN